jgi:hypothetical protein
MSNNNTHQDIISKINNFEILLNELNNIIVDSDIKTLSKTMYSVIKLKDLIESLEDKYYLRCKKEKGI